MKKNILLILSTLILFTNNVFANVEPAKIAIVDVQKIVNASPQVKALKNSQETKNKELATFIKKAQAEVNKQTDASKKKAVAEKYEKQLIAKREAIAKEYSTKLKAVDKSITEQIGAKATALGYTLVLPKSATVFGGDDITETILKGIK